MKHSLLLAAGVATAALTLPGNASATTFVVDALAHSANSGSGTGLSTGLSFTAGDAIKVSSFVQDLWSSGPVPRFSNGDGQVGNLFANAADDSGFAPGTLIGANNFGLLTINGFSAPYGSLVGRFADGAYQLFGANFNGAAAGTGGLTLFFWDSYTPDNFGDISFDIIGGGASGAVPEPMTWAMMVLGFGAVGYAMRRKPKVRLHFAR